MNDKLLVKSKLDAENCIKIAPFRSNIRLTKAHRHHNYFEIIYLLKGTGSHTIDAKEYTIKPSVVFTIRKEQVHFWDIKSQPVGFVILLKKEFLNQTSDVELKQLIARLSSSNIYYLDNHSIAHYFELLNAEFEKNNFTNSNKAIIEGLLKAIIAKIILHQKIELQPKQLPKTNTFEMFINLLNQNHHQQNNVKYYASLLHTSAQNLNRICRKEQNQSASEIISEYLISEAKRLLLYTDLHINEIANTLNFKDNSHFTKYFKKHTSFTPSEFRLK